MYLYTAGGTGLEAVIPSWAFEGGGQKLEERLNDPAIRARLKNEIKTGSPGWWNIVEASGGWNNIVLVNAQNKENARFEGKPLSQIAKEWNKEPADRGVRPGDAGTRQGVGDLSHDERAGRCHRLEVPVDEHRKRRGCRP
jgi:N-acyl-D-aspartate/D-glutamate deacylase